MPADGSRTSRRTSGPIGPTSPARARPTARAERPRAVLFDLDGTLTDPSSGIVRCLGHALGALGYPSPPPAALAARIGPPLRSTFADLLRTTDPALIERAVALYRERFGEVGLFENRVYDGVPAMLATAAARADLVLVATSKAAVYARRIVDHFELGGRVMRVYGAELDGRLEDKRELIAHLLAAEGIPAASAVMVGDRALDVRAARANGVRSIGALWGFGADGELASAGADALCPAPGDLGHCLDALVSWPARARPEARQEPPAPTGASA